MSIALAPRPWAKPPVPKNVRIDHDAWELFASVIAIEAYQGQDEYQRPLYGDPVYYRARKEEGGQTVRNVQGEEDLSTGRIHVLAADLIDARSRLTLDNGTSPPILQVDEHDDTTGVYFQTLYTGVAGFRQTSTSA